MVAEESIKLLKICSKCRQELDLSMFYKRNDGISEYRSQCKDCHASYRAANKERMAKINKRYQSENKEQISKQNKIYYTNNCEVIKSRVKKWREDNRDLYL